MVSFTEGKPQASTIVTEWLTISQAARYAGVTRQYIHSILDKFNVARLYDETGPLVLSVVELETWIQERKQK